MLADTMVGLLVSLLGQKMVHYSVDMMGDAKDCKMAVPLVGQWGMKLVEMKAVLKDHW